MKRISVLSLITLLLLLSACSSSDHSDEGLESSANWQLSWSDEFNGISLDTTKWTASNFPSPRNNEKAYYRPNNVTVNNGVLRLTAKRESFSGYSITSGQIYSFGKFDFTYGRVEVRAKLTRADGIHTAFWTLGNGCEPDNTPCLWPSPTAEEIDILEVVTRKGETTTRAYTNLHYAPVGEATRGDLCPDEGMPVADGFHTYVVEWFASGMFNWYVDGRRVCQRKVETNFFRSPQYLMLDMALGGDWEGVPTWTNPQTTEIDYVRVYKRVTPDPAVPTVVNAGFEITYDNAWAQDVSGWFEGLEKDASMLERGKAFRGNYNLLHWHDGKDGILESGGVDTEDKTETMQRLIGLSPGKYTLRAYVQGNWQKGGFTMYAARCGTSQQYNAIPSASSSWQLIELRDIEVTGSECLIGFWSGGKDQTYVMIDNVSFRKQ